jgi:GTP cyclohydrolase II
VKKLINYVFIIFCCFSFKTHSQILNLFDAYPLALEKLIYFKQNEFKAFYGGPVDRENTGIKWLMPVTFEDYTNKTRAVYEIAFINCDLHDATDAEVFFIDASDITIKCKNALSDDYSLFSSLVNGKNKNEKYILVRFSDVANVYYPDIFIYSEYGKKMHNDKTHITTFLHKNFGTKSSYEDVGTNQKPEHVHSENEDEVMYDPVQVGILFDEQIYKFSVMKCIKKHDVWKAYYVITRAHQKLNPDNRRLLRIDSGCVSGQIYDDDACDCLDQLHDALYQLTKDKFETGIIIHIPAHDGRGFGTAPKAETEIYKRGGKGRVHSTLSLDTIAAAKLLYGPDVYDLRSFDGVGDILKTMNINKVTLITDSVNKVNALKEHGIDVVRKKTNTNKPSCNQHLQSKKESAAYFSE